MGKYFGELNGITDTANRFGFYKGDRRPASFPKDKEIVVAGYMGDGHSGSATVVYERDGKLFEASASHCSCDGMQWEPAEISWKYLEKRIKAGYFYGLGEDGIAYLKNEAAKRDPVIVKSRSMMVAAIDELPGSPLDPKSGKKTARA